MNVPYFVVKQKNEEFFVMKFKAADLKDKLDFHFREPYSSSNKEKISCEKYIESIKKKGLDITSEQEGVQRRVQLGRINKIATYLEGQEDSFFPNSVVLAADVSEENEFMHNFLENPDCPEMGMVELPKDISFQIVDGQHRLAGLFVSKDEIQQNFEIFAVVLFNATKHTCAKIFRDINGNQATVNKSGIFDLLDLIEVDETDLNLKIEKNIHAICKKFNEDSSSPLYGHIKMMGIGNGAISQAFFVERVKKVLSECDMNIGDDAQIQKIYECLYYYFASFQRVFSKDWPVLSEAQFNAGKFDTGLFEKYPELREKEFREIREKYSEYILKDKKSQLLKTNGFGSILKIYPKVKKDAIDDSFKEYLEVVKKLQNKIDWSADEDLVSGTGAKIINKITERLLGYL